MLCDLPFLLSKLFGKATDQPMAGQAVLVGFRPELASQRKAWGGSQGDDASVMKQSEMPLLSFQPSPVAPVWREVTASAGRGS